MRVKLTYLSLSQEKENAAATVSARRQLFSQGESGDLHSCADDGTAHSTAASVYGTPAGAGSAGGTVALPSQACQSRICAEERESLAAQLAAKSRELAEERTRHERLYMQKNEECAKIAQALVRDNYPMHFSCVICALCHCVVLGLT
jgi:hypothetical protein